MYIFYIIVVFIFSLYMVRKYFRNIKTSETFSNVDEQADVDMNNSCLLNTNAFYEKMNSATSRIINTFKDNKHIESDFRSLTSEFGVLITYMLLSNTLYYNVFNYNELQTNIRLFRVAIYKLFRDTKSISKPTTFSFLQKRDTDTDALNEMKQMVMGGTRDFMGFKKILKTYIVVFSSLDFTKESDENKGYINAFFDSTKNEYDDTVSKVKSDSELYKHRDENIDNEQDSINIFLRKTYKLPPEFDLFAQQGFYFVQKELERWTQLKNNYENQLKDICEEVFNIYKTRTKLFEKGMKTLFHNNDCYNIWKDNKKKYGYDTYGNMERIMSNIIKYSSLIMHSTTFFDPNQKGKKIPIHITDTKVCSIPTRDI